MALIPNLLRFLSYKPTAEYHQFELLEDENEDHQVIEISPLGNTATEDGKQHPEKEATNPEESNQTNTQDNQKPKNKLLSTLSDLVQQKNKKDQAEKQQQDPKVKKDLGKNLKQMEEEFHFPLNQDFVIREFKIMQRYDAFIIYIDGMADKTVVNDFVLRQLMEKHTYNAELKVDIASYITNNILTTNQIKIETDYDKIVMQVLNGLTALFIDGNDQCIMIETRGFEKRNVSTPLIETVIKGPQEAFIENLRTNITLVRRIVRSKNLVTEMLPVGNVNNLHCALLYIKHLTNPKIVEEVKRRIQSIDTDFIADDGMLAQLIEDHPNAILPQILSTERPDRTAFFLMQGKVAIICDGTPYASIVPITVYNMFHTSEDYSLRWQYGTFLRAIRIIATLLAIFLPSLYIALTLFHQEMIPTELLASLAKSREGVPFPAIIEILLMEVSFELIREAGIRVPGVIGQTLGIIGAVILGQAAVAASLVSPVLIIIVAITGLGNFTIPNFSMSFGVRILRFIFILLAAIAGFYGIAAGIFIFGGLACSMKSFGVPYFSPVAPKTKSNHDVIIRLPTFLNKERPDYINPVKRTRSTKPVRGWCDENSGEEAQ